MCVQVIVEQMCTIGQFLNLLAAQDDTPAEQIGFAKGRTIGCMKKVCLLCTHQRTRRHTDTHEATHINAGTDVHRHNDNNNNNNNNHNNNDNHNNNNMCLCVVLCCDLCYVLCCDLCYVLCMVSVCCVVVCVMCCVCLSRYVCVLCVVVCCYL